LWFVPVPTKNGKKQPKLKYWVRDGIIENPDLRQKDIPAEPLREAYARAAVIFNKF